MVEVEFYEVYDSVSGNYTELDVPMNLWDDHDNPIAHRCQSTDQTLYMTFTMNKPCKVTKVRVASYMNVNYNYTGTVEIKGSRDNSTWTSLITIVTSGAQGVPSYTWYPSSITYSIPTNTEYWKYLYVTCYNNTRGAYGQISELIMYVDTDVSNIKSGISLGSANMMVI